MRDLSPDEKELWGQVTRAVRRLHVEPAMNPVRLPGEGRGLGTKRDDGPYPPRDAGPRRHDRKGQSPTPRKSEGHMPPARRHPPRAAPHRPGTLDGSWDRRLASGKAEIDRVVDLHGHDLERAWGLIDHELENALAAEQRVLLLITGKPPRDVPPHARGRIRAAVGSWLHASRHAPRIAAVRPAAQRHGGAGALYVVLRRNKG